MRVKKNAETYLIGVLCLCMVMLTGCGQAKELEAVTVPTISVSEKGVVTAYLVGAFDKEYYDIQELGSMVREEAAVFNKAHQSDTEQELVTVEAVEEAADGSPQVVITMRFLNAEMYQEYTGAKVFYGTVSQAHEAGYDLDTELVSVKDGSAISKTEIYDMGKKHILIAEEPIVYRCPQKVQYLNQEAILNQDGTVDASQVSGNVYIIMK